MNGPTSAEKSIKYADNSLEAVANDRSIIKILHGNKAKPQSDGRGEPNMKKKTRDN